MLTWKDRTAVISGGGGSVGFAIVCEFLQAGMNVVICSSSLEKGMETRKRLKTEWQERCEAVACDVTDPGQAKACFSFAYDRFGSVDVLVNGAGFTDRNGYGNTTLESWRKCLGSSLEGTYVMTSEAISYLEKSDSPRILNISSLAGRMGGYEEGIATVAAKGGIIAITKASARDLAAKGITVNCIAAGIEEADTPRKKRDPEWERELINRIPLQRLCRPEDIANAALFLASRENAYMTGAVIDVNGGIFMG